MVCPEPNSYVVRLNDGRLFRRTRWAINISACGSTLNPVRPCFDRPTVVGLPTATVPVASSVIGRPTLAPSSVFMQIPTTTNFGSSGLCARPGQSSVARHQQTLAPPIGLAPRFPLAARSVSSCPDPSLPAVRPVRNFKSRIPVAVSRCRWHLFLHHKRFLFLPLVLHVLVVVMSNHRHNSSLSFMFSLYSLSLVFILILSSTQLPHIISSLVYSCHVYSIPSLFTSFCSLFIISSWLFLVYRLWVKKGKML